MKSYKDRTTHGPLPDNQVPGPDNQGSLDPHASQQGSLNPPVAGTGSLDSGSLNQRAARQRTRATEQRSLDSGSLDPHASQQGSLNPPVAGTGSLDQRTASPRTNRSNLSLLPQAPEAAGVAEYIVLAEDVAQDGIDPAGPEDPHSTVPLATEA